MYCKYESAFRIYNTQIYRMKEGFRIHWVLCDTMCVEVSTRDTSVPTVDSENEIWIKLIKLSEMSKYVKLPEYAKLHRIKKIFWNTYVFTYKLVCVIQ